MKKQKSVCIIGAGPMGLAAAYYLSRFIKDKTSISITILDASTKPGGLAGSHTLQNGEQIESYYHHVFQTDKYFKEICKYLGVSRGVCFSAATVGHYHKGSLYKLNGPRDILLGGLLSPISGLRFLLASVYLKLGIDKQFSSLSAADGSLKLYGTESTQKIWLPLLEGKFSEYLHDVPMSWLASRIRDRSLKLGYYTGGFHCFYSQLAYACIQQGVTINYRTKVDTVARHDNTVEINGCLYDACLSTIGPFCEESLGINLPRNLRVKYLGAICAVYELDSNPEIPYWTNYCDPRSPVLAVINHRELENSTRLADCYPVYSAAYLDPSHELFSLADPDIADLFFSPVLEVARASKNKSLPMYKRATVYRTRYAQPLINPDVGLPPIINRKGPLYSASMHSIYPNDRGQNYAIGIGKEMALTIARDLDLDLDLDSV
jgi:protoporphyrinogen oxidase